MTREDCPKAALFDLDDTLAESFESPSPEILGLLLRLLERIPLAIVTGRDFPWMQRDFLDTFAVSPHVERFFVLPEGAAQCLMWDGRSWTELYAHSLSDEERTRIVATIRETILETGVLEGQPTYGAQARQKKAMVAFSMLGVDVPKDMRHTWDPGNMRRMKLRDALAAKLPEFDVVLGGATTVDVTKKGVNKSYGVRFLAERLGYAPGDMIYVGDALFPGGNDFVVIATGIVTRPTTGPNETKGILEELLRACNG